MSRKDERFTFVLDQNERRILSALAERFQRTESDCVRWLIRNTAAELNAAGTDTGAGKLKALATGPEREPIRLEATG